MDGGRVEIFAGVSPGQNVGRRGADIHAGDLVVRRGDHLNPSRVGAIAAEPTERAFALLGVSARV